MPGPGPTFKGCHCFELADPEFCAADPIELLLGAEAYSELALPGLHRGGPSESIAQHTKLGWIILGPAQSGQAAIAISSLQCSITDELGALLRRFWESEEPPRPPLLLSPEERGSSFSRTCGILPGVT